AVLSFATTVRCWLAMGSNWSMAVNPKKPTRLLTEGVYSVVRHPIYALSLLLMLCTMLVVANLPMLLVGAIHITMLVGKAASEERYLLGLHGEAYAQYCRMTNRFLPCRWPASQRQVPSHGGQ
ncbi:MAG: isoprenylcysteine carboxylmethyltransferase family protein, partial [Planctomycetes bacterium]|nr:isoprenylcysteine carboxylmethyltransferase family protein [Planctomycetota bacterium]